MASEIENLKKRIQILEEENEYLKNNYGTKLYHTIDLLPIGLYFYDKDGIITDCNTKFIEIVKSTKDKLLGLNTITKLKNKDVIQATISSLETGYGSYYDYYESVTGDAEIFAKGEFIGIRNKKNDIVGGICIIEDITDQHKKEKELSDASYEYKAINDVFIEQNEELINTNNSLVIETKQNKKILKELSIKEKKYRSLFETAPDGIFEIDKNGNIINYNTEFAKSIKSTKEKLIGTHFSKYLFNKKLSNSFFANIKKHKSYESEFIQKNFDGTSVNVWIKASSLFDKQDEFTGAIIYSINIDNIKETENLLINAKNKAEESDKLKSAFLSNMSHEIRTPLNAIIGFSKIISTTELPNRDKIKYNKYINTNSKLLLNIINDIVDISKIEADQITISKNELDLNNLFKELYVIYLSEIKASNKGIKLMLEMPSENLIINNDEFRLKQILINLLSNALKFTERGTITFGFEIKEDKFNLFIKDTGTGIPENKLDDIFNRFVRIHDSEAKYKGTGLGLTIVEKLVNLLDGEIVVKSKIDIGTEFNIFFSSKSIVKYQKDLITDEEPLNNVNFSEKTILIAEDDEFNYIVLDEFLKESKINIIRANNGIEAIDLYKKYIGIIDLVLMDIQMPILNGYEASKQIIKINKNAIIIAQTAFALSNEKDETIEAGCVDYITKPIDADALIKLLIKYL